MPVSSRSITALSVVALLLAVYWSPINPGWYAADTTHCYDDIKTLSPDLPHAKCITVSSAGIITQVHASIDDAPRTSKRNTGAVIPGLWDGHGHLLQLGELLRSVDLFGALSLVDALQRVERYVEMQPGVGSRERWVRGVGWDQAAFGRMPTAADLGESPLLRNKYIMLDRVDVHCIWVSEAVLALLPKHLKPVAGGEIITKPGRGVFCDNAMDMVNELFPKPDTAEQTHYVRTAMKHLNAFGIVGIHDAGNTPQTLDLYKQLARTPDWTVRMCAMLECAQRNTFCAADAARFRATNVRDRLWVRSVKLFADGALGSWGSAMLAPYSDRPASTGSLLINGSALTALAHSWTAAGYQVSIHAIGDLANRLAISALESALVHFCPPSSTNDSTNSTTALQHCQDTTHRFRIEHAQIIHPLDQQRMHALHLIPSLQPTHATSDSAYAPARLGAHRLATSAYRTRSLLPLRPVLGSDVPVEPASPFHGMYAAVVRRDPRRRSSVSSSSSSSSPSSDAAASAAGAAGEAGWHTEEAITLSDALAGFTQHAAHAAFLESRAGVLAVGALADWLVLDEAWDASVGGCGLGAGEQACERLLDLEVRETWVGGQLVYDRNAIS